LPGGKPVHFDITARNYGRAAVSGRFTFQVCSYQICALAGVRPGQLELICDPWTGHASDPRGAGLGTAAIQGWLQGWPPIAHPAK
jgi:hypothetical protein